MKNLFVIILFVISACSIKKHPSNEDFDWLIGSWQRTNEEKGKSTYESWVKLDASEYRGLSYTLKGTDTIWQENVRLRRVGDHWNYEVMQKGDSRSTAFLLREIGKKRFTCENDSNGFPKKIVYIRDKDKIHSAISGGEMEIPFEFQKVK